MDAVLTNNVTGEKVKVHSTTEHPDSSYGKAVWVDDNNQSYCQVGMEKPFYSVEEIK